MKLWKYRSGCVNIRIMGKYQESLVNRCVESGMALEDVLRDEGGVKARLPAAELYRLRSLGRGTNCRIRILKKRGLPIIKRAARMNAVFAASLTLFLLASLALSTRLWFISIDSPVVPEAEIARMLEDSGVSRGARRAGVKSGEIARMLLLDPRVVNAKVVLRGVRLEVTIAGRGGSRELVSDEEPANIYADTDCVVRYISVSRGRAEVRAGSAVKAGDVLIRGELSDLKAGYAVRAEGLVYGEVARVFTATAPREKTAPARSGESVSVNSIFLFGLELFPKPPYAGYELVSAGEARLTGSPVPVSVRSYTAYELVESEILDSRSGTEERARLMAQEKMAGAIPEGARIIAVKTVCADGEDGCVTAVITVTTIEKIGTTRSF